MGKISVTLTAAHMGNVDETDFDLWTKFVTENIDEALGFDVHDIEQGRFPCGAGADVITGATQEQRDAIRAWLDVDGWNAFCGEAWETMRREHDAAA